MHAKGRTEPQCESAFDGPGEWLYKTFPQSRGVRSIQGATLFLSGEMPEIIAEEALTLSNV